MSHFNAETYNSTPQWDGCAFRSSWTASLPKRISDNGKVLLLENVAPSCSDKVPGQRHPHDVMGNGLDGGDGILLADLVRVKSVVQVSGSGKKAKHCHCLITQAKHSSPRLCDEVRLTWILCCGCGWSWAAALRWRDLRHPKFPLDFIHSVLLTNLRRIRIGATRREKKY